VKPPVGFDNWALCELVKSCAGTPPTDALAPHFTYRFPCKAAKAATTIRGKGIWNHAACVAGELARRQLAVLIEPGTTTEDPRLGSAQCVPGCDVAATSGAGVRRWVG